jgi:T5SS/PEP-CTERM-associated repeat protein
MLVHRSIVHLYQSRGWFVTAMLVGAACQSGRAAVTVNGSTSANPTSTNADPIIGVNDVGRLTITASSVVVSDVAIVGDQLTGIGLVSVSDFNTGTASAGTWTTNSLMVGNQGTGRLEVTAGAIVNVDFAANPGEGDFVVGNAVDGIGTVIVRGLGSLLRLGDDSFIGQAGTGILNIEDDGLVIGTNDIGLGTDIFTVGVRGRVQLNGGRLRTESMTVNGAIQGTGRIDNEMTIAVSTTGRIQADSGDRLVINAAVDSDGEIAVQGGEIEFLEPVINSNQAAKVVMDNGIVRFPKSGFGLDTTTGTLATTAGVNDIYGTLRLQGAGSKIVVAGESTAVFHDPVTNNGGVIEVFPGSTPIYLQGLSTMGSGSLLSIHLADPDDSPDFGQLEVAGGASLAGNLEIKLAAGFTPSVGDSFQILTSAGGITGSLNLSAAPVLPTGMQWDLDILPNRVVLNVVGTGDYNGNGIVDAADYAVWRGMMGQSGPGLAADGNGNGVVDNADYDFWRRRFGNQVFAGGSAVATSIPEPTVTFMVVSSCIGVSYYKLISRRRPAARMCQIGAIGGHSRKA